MADRLKHRRQLALLVATFAALLPVITPRVSRAQSKAEDQQGAAVNPEQEPSELPAVLPRGQKLVLKDGTFQIVREYHREDDRVRYYSLERSAWEEIPESLVDWDATQKAHADEAAQKDAVSQKLKAEEAANRAADIHLSVDKSFEVRPGIILPDAVGLYTLDGNLIVLMGQDKTEVHIDSAREAEKIITGVPFISSRHSIEIPGKAAKTRIHSAEPEFYFRPADGRMPKLSLLRAEVKDNKRNLETMSTDIVGNITYKNREVSLLFWEEAPGLYRFTVDQMLAPGEYALTETIAQGQQATYVWDFGVSSAGTKDTASKATKTK